jgi:hypothetical protein
VREYLKISNDKVIVPKLIVENLNEIRKLLISTSNENREKLVTCFLKEGFIKDMIKFVEEPSFQNFDILEQITWIFLLIFSSNDKTQILEILVNYDLVTHLNELLSLNHVEIFSNVVWCFANLINNNTKMKKFLVDFKIFDKIQERIEEIEKEGTVLNPSFYLSFVIFLNSYQTTIPFDLTQSEIEGFLMRCLSYFVHSSPELLSFFEPDLLNCIRNLTHFMEETLLVSLLKRELFGNFINKVFVCFVNKKYKFKNHIISILGNLTTDVLREITIVFEQTQIQKALLISLKDEQTMKDTALLIGNVVLDEDVLESFFTNKNEGLFETLLHLIGHKVNIYSKAENQVEELLRALQNFLLNGKSIEFNKFCLYNHCKKDFIFNE